MATDDDIERIFASNLKRLRQRAGLSQEGLSATSGLSREYVGRIERVGRANPTIVTVKRVARVLGATVVDLLTPRPKRER